MLLTSNPQDSTDQAWASARNVGETNEMEAVAGDLNTKTSATKMNFYEI